MKLSNIRNFCIIAHIDHGKSTLADRFLEITGTIDKRFMKAQTLDSMELEREKGITIKLKPVRMEYTFENQDYELNLIDTPGHVDFSYEVSRSLAACEGAILVVDASQGIQAQTVSNVYRAKEAGLKIIPIVNKIDLPGSEIEKTKEDMQKTFGFSYDEILEVSAKTGFGVVELLTRIIKKIPSPLVSSDQTLKCLIFDTVYDEYLGVVAMVRIVDGEISEQDIKKRRQARLRRQVRFISTGATSFIEEIGIFKPAREKILSLHSGEVGYIATGLKDIHAVKVGDTVTFSELTQVKALPGYKETKPFVFVSIYPIDTSRFPSLRTALEKLSLSDASLSYEPEQNNALGFGFRCGFLGLLHADVVQERLEREYDLELISTIPTVEYKILLTDEKEIYIKNPANFPDPTKIYKTFEPWLKLTIVSPSTYTGAIISLCEDRRGVMGKMEYLTPERVIFEYDLPLSELILNFYDDLKSASSGFASLDYELSDYRESEVVRLDILVHGENIGALSSIVLKSKAEKFGRFILKKLKDVIPKQQFQISLQATISGKIIAREDISAFRKNVLAKMSGGHRERKDKLLDIQRKGKKRMKMFGKVEIPQEAFRQILSS